MMWRMEENDFYVRALRKIIIDYMNFECFDNRAVITAHSPRDFPITMAYDFTD